MRKSVATVFLLTIGAASPSLGNPSPSGTCTLFDDGIAISVRMETPAQGNPHVISMDIPGAESESN
jgi:hypothetical protein